MGADNPTRVWGTPVAQWQDTTGRKFNAYETNNGTTIVRVSDSDLNHYTNPFNDDFDRCKWEDDLRRVIDLGNKFRETFKVLLRGGWIPHKGYGGEKGPPTHVETTNAPATVDLRRGIRVITTPRQCAVP